MFDYLLQSSHRDDSNKWFNIGFGEDIMQVLSIEVNFTHPYLCHCRRCSEESGGHEPQ